ncbi:macro domain-containing protein [Zymobacter sp. IVIA_12111.31 C1]|uniref:type II toxin-antitoxin system antitoxin DNA ADP-ribosyl glycohydrolase DarG n=1 Tax=Zymobacter sp. IVIA_12111.31 C1 TaxID=3394854 RepID=UPI0039C2B240
MITYTQGNLLEANVDALVNAVNTVGVMGKGIALAFKQCFPDNMEAYAKACKAGELEPGRMFITATHAESGPQWIINFPTKRHWRGKSQMAWIEEGLTDLKRVIEQHHIQSIAIPALGAGNGGLPWDEVKALIELQLQRLEAVDIHIYEPFE